MGDYVDPDTGEPRLMRGSDLDRAHELRERMKNRKPDWQDWPEEPLTLESEDECYGVRDKNGKFVFAGLPYDLRALACVNALAGIRNPAAVAEVIEAARELEGSGCELDDKRLRYEVWQTPPEAMQRLLDALAALDRAPASRTPLGPQEPRRDPEGDFWAGEEDSTGTDRDA